MKSITIKIKTENEAFDEVPEYEVSRILSGIADAIRHYRPLKDEQPLYDTNGNKVGKLTIK